MTDFFREVDEEVRRDRAIKFWTKYQVPIIGLILLAIAGTAGWRIVKNFRDDAAAAAGARYEAALQLSQEDKGAEAEAALKAIAEEGPKGYKTLARLRYADEIAKRNPEAAIKAYEALAADTAYDQRFRDVARLREAMLRLDRDDPAEFEQKFAPFASVTYPYRNSMRELLGLAALKRGDTEAAGRWLDAIVTDQLAPRDLRIRAGALLGLVQSGKRPASAAQEPPPEAKAEPEAKPASEAKAADQKQP